MKGAITASGRDLRTLAGIVSDDRGEPPADGGEGLAPSLLTDLLGLVGGDLAVFSGTDSSRQVDWFGQTVPIEAHAATALAAGLGQGQPLANVCFEEASLSACPV